MRLLGSVVSLLALAASAPALASDYSTDRHFTSGNTQVVRVTEARPEAPAASPVRKVARDCDCSCARRPVEGSAAASRAEPGGH
jgi:hypothetical protein